VISLKIKPRLGGKRSHSLGQPHQDEGGKNRLEGKKKRETMKVKKGGIEGSQGKERNKKKRLKHRETGVKSKLEEGTNTTLCRDSSERKSSLKGRGES